MRVLVAVFSFMAMSVPSSLVWAEPSTPAPASSTGDDGMAELDEEVQPPPASTRWPLLFGGLGVTAAWYGAAVGASYAFPDAAGVDDLRVPIVGPWLSLTHTGCGPTNPGCDKAWVAVQAILTILDGLGQASGPLFILESILLPTREAPSPAPRSTPMPRRQVPAPSTPEPPADGNKNLFFLPRPTLIGQGGLGLQVWGRF